MDSFAFFLSFKNWEIINDPMLFDERDEGGVPRRLFIPALQ